MAAGSGGSPDQQDPDAQRKMFDLDRAMSVLRASSGVNPMIAAAGAMLSPTRTGGFSESLGNAFTAYAHGAETERSQDEQSAQRLLQAQWQNDYRQQMASAATSRAASYGTSVADKSQLIQAQSSMDMARAAMLQARAAAGTAAHVTPGDLQAQAMNSLLTPGSDGKPPINPDTGNPFTKLEAYNATQAATASAQNANTRAGVDIAKLDQQRPLIDARVAAIQGTQDYRNQLLALKARGLSDTEAKNQLDGQIRQQQTDILQQKVDQQQPLVDAKVQSLQSTQQYHDGIQQLRAQGVEFNQALAVGTLASKIMAAKPGTSWSQAFDQAKQGLPGVGGQPASPAHGAPAAGSSQPAVSGTTPAAPAQRAPPPSAYPNSQWSDKYGTYIVPGSAPGKWIPVGSGQAPQ